MVVRRNRVEPTPRYELFPSFGASAPSSLAARRIRLPDASAVEPAHQPQHNKDDGDQTESPAEPASAIAVVAIVTTATTKDHGDEDDNQDCAHGKGLSGNSSDQMRLRRCRVRLLPLRGTPPAVVCCRTIPEQWLSSIEVVDARLPVGAVQKETHALWTMRQAVDVDSRVRCFADEQLSVVPKAATTTKAVAARQFDCLRKRERLLMAALVG